MRRGEESSSDNLSFGLQNKVRSVVVTINLGFGLLNKVRQGEKCRNNTLGFGLVYKVRQGRSVVVTT